MLMAGFKLRLSPLTTITALFATATAVIVALFFFLPVLSARADVGDNGTGANTANIEVKYVMASAAKITFGLVKPQNLTYTLSDGTTTETNPITDSTSTSAQLTTSSTTWASGATVILTISSNGLGVASLDGFGSGSTGDAAATSNTHMRRLISFGSFGITKLNAAFAKTPSDFTIYPQLPSTVTSLYWAFASSNSNPDISNWDVSRVTTLFGAFSAAAFNRNLNSWDVSAVTEFNQVFSGVNCKFNNGNATGVGGNMTWLPSASLAASINMSQMFSGNSSFNQNVSSWNVSKSVTFQQTFNQATKFNNGQSAGGAGTAPLTWNTGNATTFDSMFTNATVFNQSISGFDTSKATTTASMFWLATAFNNGNAAGASGTLTLNTSLVTSMDSMFKSATAFNQNISGFDMSKVTTTQSMFYSASAFNNGQAAGVSGTWTWNTTLVSNWYEMFRGATAFNQDISGFDVSKATNIGGMFSGATAFNNGLASGVSGTWNWNTPLLTSMNSTFKGASSFNQNINSWNVARVTDMGWMFQLATKFNQPLDNWNTASVQGLTNMFDGATVFNQSLASFNISRGNSIAFVHIFGSAANMTSGMDGANLDRTLVSWSYQRSSFGDFGAYGKPKWSTCAGYYAIQRMTANFTGWTTPSTTPIGCTSPTVTWSSSSPVTVNNKTVRDVSPTAAATTDSMSQVRYVIRGFTGSGGNALCHVNYTTGVFSFLATGYSGTCGVRAFDPSDTGDGSSTSYVDVTYELLSPVFAPSPLSATVVSNTQVNLAWTPPSSVGTGFVDFQIEYSSDNAVTWTVFEHTPSTAASASITGLQGNTSYRFRVAVINVLGVNEFNTTTARITKPSAPTSVTANSFENGTISVSWVPATQGTAYAISYKAQASFGGSLSALCASTPGTSCSMSGSGVNNGRTYDIAVVPTANSVDGAASTASVTATPSAGVTSLATGTPTSFTVPLTWVQPVNTSSVTLTGITGYTVQYSTGTYSTWTDASTTVAAGTGYTVTGLAGNTSYKFRVRLNNPANTAPWITTSVAVQTTPVVPAAPTVVSGTSDANGSSVISWTPGSNGGSAIIGYLVEYSTDGAAWTTAIASTPSSPYTLTGLTNGTSYYVRVSGINAIGTGPAGVSAATFLPGTLPGAPTGVSGTSSEMGQSTVSWSAPASDGGRAITSYTATSIPGGFTCAVAAPATSCVVSGLTYGANYTFTVTATTVLGLSSSSSASASVLVGGLPTAPTVHNAGRNGTFFESNVFPPASNGGAAITGYQYRYKLTIGASWTNWAAAPTPTPTTVNGQSALYFVVPGITATVNGQVNWGAIQFRAVNSVGAGATSVQAPNVVDVAITGQDNGQFTFDFDLSDDGNAAIIDYQYQILPSDTQTWSSWVSMGVSSDAQPFTITGLTNGIGYGLRVRAENAYGYSTGSQSRVSTTPTGFPNKPLPTLTFSYPISTTVFVANATFTPTFSNNGNGVVTFTSRALSVCSVDPVSGVVTVLSAGQCLIRMTVDEGTLHRASLLQADFTVTAAAQSALNWNVPNTSAPYRGSILMAVTGGDGSGQVTYAKSGTSTCSIIGAIVVLGDVGSVCSVTATKAASGGFAAVSTTTPLLLTSTPITQEDVVATFGSTAFVNQAIALQATGGSGTGAYQYTVANAGTTGCAVDSNTNTVTFTGAGSCVVSVARAASTNYNVSSSTSKTIVVSQRTQSVTFTSSIPTQPIAGGTYLVTATSSSALSVTLSVTSGPCAVANGEISFTSAGPCVVSAAQAGDSVYLPASATQTIVIGQRNQALSFDAATNAISTKTFGGIGFLIQASSSESTATLVYSVSSNTTNSACIVTSSGFVTIQAVGTCVIEVNAAGSSAFAAASPILKTISIVADLPGAPAIGSVSAGNMRATLGFFAPSYTGGAAITGYRVIAVDQAAGSTLEVSDSSCGIVPVNSIITCLVSGLTNGKTYKLKVAAINEAGTGAFSALSAAITVATNPSAVQNLSVVEGNASLIIGWSAPDSLGGGTFSAYRIFIKKSVATTYDQDHFFNVVNYNTTSVTVSLESPGDGMTFLGGPALQNGVAYDIKIVTVTTANLLELEANTAKVNQIPHTVPDAPLVASSVVVGGQLVITWAAPLSDGGKAITGYSVTFQNVACALANANDKLCAVALPTAPGTYTYQVVATNSAGQSAPRTGTFFVASAPVRQPASSGTTQPPVVKPLAPIIKSVSVATDGKFVTVLGFDLTDILTVTLGTIQAKIISQDGQTLVIESAGIPAGIYDLMIAFKDGTKLREVGSVTIVGAKPVTPAKFSARKVSGFAKGSALLSAGQVRELKTYFKTIRGKSTIECIGSTEGPSILKADAKLAMKRAVYVCSLAKGSGVKIKSTSYVNQVKVGANYRSVALKVWKTAKN